MPSLLSGSTRGFIYRQKYGFQQNQSGLVSSDDLFSVKKTNFFKKNRKNKKLINRQNRSINQQNRSIYRVGLLNLFKFVFWILYRKPINFVVFHGFQSKIDFWNPVSTHTKVKRCYFGGKPEKYQTVTVGPENWTYKVAGPVSFLMGCFEIKPGLTKLQ
jgi:hypothetical protein